MTTFTATYEEYKETLIDVIDDLTRHSYIAKLKVISSWYRTKSKATTGVKNNASHIPWLYPTWDQMVASNMIHCFSSDGNNHYTSFLYQVQTMLVYYLKADHPHIIKIWFTSLTIVEDSTKTTRTSWKDVCVLISMILVLVLNKLVLPVMELGEQIKRHLAKRSLRRFLINLIISFSDKS